MFPSRSFRWLSLTALAAAPLVLGGLTCDTSHIPPVPGDFSTYTVVSLAPGLDLEQRARDAMLQAQPGTIIEFPAGFYEMDSELNLDVSHVVLRGQGMNQTTLSFRNQTQGAQGIVVTADAVVIEDLAVEDTKGDGIKIQLANGITIDRVRVEWTNGPKKTNGAYGFYPVDCENVLIQNSLVSGASDAGIYVGQSEKIIVRYNTVKFNVAGIEIENSRDADVYLNEVFDNTGGILVFDMPGLPKLGSVNSRVFLNSIHDNNTPNFAHGGAVGLVPAGTGILVLANDEVEVMSNAIFDNDSIGVAIAAYASTTLPLSPNPPGFPAYDGYAEKVSIHGNTMLNNGKSPDGTNDISVGIGLLFFTIGHPGIPDIAFDGVRDPAKVLPGGELPDDLRICVWGNGAAEFGDLHGFQGAPTLDPAPYDCRHPAQPPIVLDPPVPMPPATPGYTPAQIDALCNAPGTGVNWAAIDVNCPELGDYRLFATGDPTQGPNAGGVPFDLTTPLFSDYTTKYRFAFLPPNGSGGVQPAQWSDTEPFDFPVGTIIAKTFTYQRDFRNPALGERWMETRLLIRRASGWVGLPYVWEDDRSRATLTPGGTSRDVSWTHFDGSLRETRYRIPNTSQCVSCHNGFTGADPIGPKARLLNRDLAYPGGTQNQLDHWIATGFLAGAPAIPSSQMPRLPVWNDVADGTQDERARAYLEVNCAHCHNPLGRARFSGLHLAADVAYGSELGICKTPTAAGTGSGDLPYDIVPGDPSQSILVYRLASVDPAIKMPELAKGLVHEEGLALVTAWIQSLSGGCP